MVGVQFSHFNDFFHFHHTHFARHGHRWVEVASSQTKLQIAYAVSGISFDEGHIGDQRAFHHIGFAIEFAQFFAIGHHSAHTSFGKESRNASTAGTQLFSQGTLWCKFQL